MIWPSGRAEQSTGVVLLNWIKKSMLCFSIMKLNMYILRFCREIKVSNGKLFIQAFILFFKESVGINEIDLKQV